VIYGEEQQIKDAVGVLCERMNRERPPWANTPRARQHQVQWREAMVRDALRDISSTSSSAAEKDEIAAAKTKQSLKVLTGALRRAHTATASLPSTIQSSLIGEIEKLIARCDRWSTLHSRPPHRSAHRQRAAVEWAEFLITVTDEYDASRTRGGQWHRLASILYGDPDYDLYRHMLKYKNGRWLDERGGPE
jgi:hypothetical protein